MSETAFHIAGRLVDERLTVEAHVPGFGAFTETVTWPFEVRAPQALTNLAVALLGVSYYKLDPAGTVIVDASLTPAAKALVAAAYGAGLGEFRYRNELAHIEHIDVKSRLALPEPVDTPAPDQALVAVGGGKDSAVAMEAVKAAGQPARAVCINPKPLHERAAAAAELDLVSVTRQLDPRLKEANEAGGLNGHVPITAITSVLATMAGESMGGADIVFANERSADEATLMTGEGEAINHQWSKSSAFEGLFRKALAEAGASSRYFSIIRALSELSVLKAFSGLGRHHHVVSSCNRNFAEGAEDRGAWWCCRCPKCAFTALGLALFLPRGQVEAMMGGNPLNDPEMLGIYEALTGLSAAKPWECVGTRDESAAALFALGKRDGWAECLAVAVLGPRLDSVLGADTLRAALHSALTPEPASHVPDSYERALTALL